MASAIEMVEASRELPSPTPFVAVVMSVGEAERARSNAEPDATADGEFDEYLYEIFDGAVEHGPFYDFAGRPFGIPQTSPAPTFIPNPFGRDDDRSHIGTETRAAAPSRPEADLLGRMTEMLKWLDGFGGQMAVHPTAYPWSSLCALQTVGLLSGEDAGDDRRLFAFTDAGRAQLAAIAGQ